MIELLYNIIFIFLYYLCCICIYIIYNNKKNKKIHIKAQPLKLKIKNIIKEELNNFDNNRTIDKDNLNIILSEIKNKKYKKEVINVLLNYKDREKIIRFINFTNLLQPVLNKKDKDEYDKSYKIYLIGEFKNQNYYRYLVESCDDKSTFVQINALKALVKLEDEKYFLEGLRTIMKSSSLIHEKVISDNIYSISMKKCNINRLLMYEINNANDDLKKLIINQFLNTKFSECKDIVYKLLKNKNTELEVKLACIKYFSAIKYKKAKSILLHLLNDEIWEVRALTATALKNYKSDDVETKLKQSIKDPVWYVRQNSARSLYNLVENKDELLIIINGEDKYASDAIKSIMSEKDKKEFEFIPKRTSKKKVVYNLNEVLEEQNINEGQKVGNLQC